MIIGMLWFIWNLNCIFNQVIMLNFMIAIISQSYEKVMAQKNQLMYSYKADMNAEVEIFITYFEWFCARKKPLFNSIILVSSSDPNSADEWIGLSGEVKGLMNNVLISQKYNQRKASLGLDKLI